MGRASSRDSREAKLFKVFWTSSSFSGSELFWFLFDETTSFSSSVSSGVPIEDELSEEWPEKRPYGRSAAGTEAYGGSGGEEATSMVKVGPTSTSIFANPRNEKEKKKKNRGKRKRICRKYRVFCFCVGISKNWCFGGLEWAIWEMK